MTTRGHRRVRGPLMLSRNDTKARFPDHHVRILMGRVRTLSGPFRALTRPLWGVSYPFISWGSTHLIETPYANVPRYQADGFLYRGGRREGLNRMTFL